jgi:hypothetical protein
MSLTVGNLTQIARSPLATLVIGLVLVLASAIAVLCSISAMSALQTPPPFKLTSDVIVARSDSALYKANVSMFDAQTTALKARQTVSKESITGLMDLLKVFATAAVAAVFTASAGKSIQNLSEARLTDAQTRLHLAADRSTTKTVSP